MKSIQLTEKQSKAAHHLEGPALTLAVPGSGKTTLLLYRIHLLINEHHINPKHILTLTFSKASANDMNDRFKKTYNYEGPQFMTIHRFAYSIVKDYMKSTGQHRELIETTNLKFKLLKEIYYKVTKNYLTEDLYEDLLGDLGLISNLMLKENDPYINKLKSKDSLKINTLYRQAKKEHGYMDFDDMILMAYKILKANPKALNFFQNYYHYIQVDEAQDTSKLQFELINLIASPKNNLFFVADDDQSIYGFRGAYPEYLLNFENQYKGASVYYIEQNFRSSPEIIEKCCQVIVHNQSRFKKSMIPTQLNSTDVNIEYFDNQFHRNEKILSIIENLPKNETIGILYRNKLSSMSLIDQLEIHNVDFYIKDIAKSFTSHWIYKDIIAFFNLALVPEDIESFHQIAFKTNAFISKEMVSYVKSNIRNRTVFDTLIETPFLESYQTKTQEKTKKLFDELRTLSPLYGIQHIEIELGYLDYLYNRTKQTDGSIAYLRSHLEIIKTIAERFTTPYELISRLEYLRDYLKHIQSSDELTADKRVTLSTIHASKGLEFDHVIIVDINPGTFPSKKSEDASKKGDLSMIEEERRLMYVAMSRARKHLEIFHCNFVSGVLNKDSIFIKECKKA